MNSCTIPIAHNIYYVNLYSNNLINKISITRDLQENKKTGEVFTQVLIKNPGCSILHSGFLMSSKNINGWGSA